MKPTRMRPSARGNSDSGESSGFKPKSNVWSRELRNRFVLTSGKRSLRFQSKNGRPDKRIRRCRLTAVLSQHEHHYSSDDETMFTPPATRRRMRKRLSTHIQKKRESERINLSRTSSVARQRGSSEDEEDDDDMFTPPATRMRNSRLTSHLAKPCVSERPRRSLPNMTTNQGEGIRRSQRQRKSKFENCNDSWLVGPQSLRGYPSLSEPNFQKEKKEEPAEGAEDDEVEEEEAEEEEEEEEEMEEDEVSESENCIRENGDETPSKRPVRITRQSKLGANSHIESNETRVEAGSSEEGDAENEDNDANESYQDMYARVKQRRRQRRKTEVSSDSSDSSSEDEPRRIRTRNQNGRVEKKQYHLRQTKPTVDRFQIAEPPSRSHVLREVIAHSLRRRRRRASSTSSSSSSDDRYDRKKKGKSRNRLELAGGDNKANTGKLADVDPISLDQSIRFSNIGGLEKHVACLKEMILFPILYPELFSKFGVAPPKGVLFHGPPGTGKTLMARALANECSQGDRKVSFFMRKGADCLSKWVGESERQLRILFEEAHQGRPSIIFFDELDGLAPVRSSKQDQIHASIVCTLLALMDGLDNRGDIIIIGATNRIDSIDPALRRPGRFDRELHFPLPGVKERREILSIHAKNWAEPGVLNRMAETSAGYCGSDLKALCTEAVIQALKRVYPQIYDSNRKLLLDHNKVKVEKVDFERAQRTIVPAAQRALSALGRKLPQYLDPLLSQPLAYLLSYVGDVFPTAFNRNRGSVRVSRSPRLLIVGEPKQTCLLATGLLYKLEHCPTLSIAFETLYSESSRSPEETVTKVFKELPHSSGSILWFGDISLWWRNVSDSVKAVFISLSSLLDPALPVLYLATSKTNSLPSEVRKLFRSYRNEIYTIPKTTREQKENFFRPLFRMKALRPPPPPKKKVEELEPLAEAPPTPPPKLTSQQLEALYNEEENTLRELRIFLRQICAKLARNKQFYMFSKPVDTNEVPDYLQVIKEPMDLETMMTKIDLHKYTCAQDFLNDIDLLCMNALEYNPDRDPADKLIRHRACYLRDTAYALIKAEMDSDFEVNCRTIREARKGRPPLDEPGTLNEEPQKDSQDGLEMENEKLKDESKDDSTQNGNRSQSDRKKRRKKWSKGCIPKKVKKCSDNPSDQAPQSPCSSKVDLGEPSNQSTPVKGRRSKDEFFSHDKNTTESDILENGLDESFGDDVKNEILNGDLTLEDSACDTEERENRKVIIDRDALNRLLAETVEIADRKSSFEGLIDLYSALAKIIDSFIKFWNRENMIEELEKELKRYKDEFEDFLTTEEEDDGHSLQVSPQHRQVANRLLSR